MAGSVNKDNGCWKLLSMVTQLFGLLSALSALASFGENCKGNVADEFDAELGVGFILPMIGTLLNGVVFILFALCPSPESQGKSATDETVAFKPIAQQPDEKYTSYGAAASPHLTKDAANNHIDQLNVEKETRSVF